jgi:hypothetical protein
MGTERPQFHRNPHPLSESWLMLGELGLRRMTLRRFHGRPATMVDAKTW